MLAEPDERGPNCKRQRGNKKRHPQPVSITNVPHPVVEAHEAWHALAQKIQRQAWQERGGRQKGGRQVVAGAAGGRQVRGRNGHDGSRWWHTQHLHAVAAQECSENSN